MSDGFDTLPEMLAQVWQALACGVADPGAAARHPTLATLGVDGWPEARSVVLRGVDAGAAVATIHTDLRSAKIAALRANPRAALHVWDAGLRLQIRATAEVGIGHGATVAAIWDRLPASARQNYGATPPPGMPLAGPHEHHPGPGAAVFAVLTCRINRIDALHLGTTPQESHRRAQFERVDGWAGRWVAP